MSSGKSIDRERTSQFTLAARRSLAKEGVAMFETHANANFVRQPGLTRSDTLLLLGFCLCLFGYSLIGGRPLTMHEGVLPQSAREMFADHDWVIPKNGGRPWLESPPLPQWITVAIASLLGRCDEVWIVRIGPALAATWAVLLTAWMTAGWYGRKLGLLTGCIFATMYEFTLYAWLAEDEIFLCAIVTSAVALFVRTEFFYADSAQPGSRNFFGSRPKRLLALFVVLGLTNLAKGILFGTVMSLVGIAGFLLWNGDWRRISYYFWFWGWLAFVAIAAAWPVAAYLRYHDVVELWLFDHKGRLDGTYQDITQPVWYYLKMLPSILAPWIFLVPLGLWLSWRSAVKERYSPARFVWCWAILTPLVFSIPSGKHHHYLLHCIAPWAVIVAPALVWIRDRLRERATPGSSQLTLSLAISLPLVAGMWLARAKIPGPVWMLPMLSVVIPLVVVLLSRTAVHPDARLAGVTLFGLLGVAFCAGHTYAGKYFDQCRHDTHFLHAVREYISPDKQLAINTNLRSLDEFRILFYLDDRTLPLHNLSYLADERLRRDEVYVLTKAGDAPYLAHFGQPELVLQSEKTRREKSPADRLSLFRLNYSPAAPRLSSKELYISPMQTMQRSDGPYLTTLR